MATAGPIMTSGSRKEAVARIRMVAGSGSIQVNGRPAEQYFPKGPVQTVIKQPLVVANAEGRFDIIVHVTGGGVHGQAGAVRHGSAGGLTAHDAGWRARLGMAGRRARCS